MRLDSSRVLPKKVRKIYTARLIQPEPLTVAICCSDFPRTVHIKLTYCCQCSQLQAAHECLAKMITEVEKLFSVSPIPVRVLFKFLDSNSSQLYFLLSKTSTTYLTNTSCPCYLCLRFPKTRYRTVGFRTSSKANPFL